jgi:hypothetical protein
MAPKEARMSRQLHRPVRLDPDYRHRTETSEVGEESATEIAGTRAYRQRSADPIGRLVPEVAELRRLITRLPFRPFRISTARGSTIEVKQADLVAISLSGDRIVIFDADGVHLVRTLTIASIVLGKAPHS